MTQVSAKTIALNYLEAFSTGDADVVAANVTADFVNEQVGELGTGCEGAETYRQRLVGFLDAFKNLRYEIRQAVAEGNTVAVAYDMHFDHGREDIKIPGVMMITVRDGRVAYRADYWDGLTYQKLTD